MTLENRTVEHREGNVRLSLLGFFPRTREARYVKPTGENTLLLIIEGRCYGCKRRQQDKKYAERKGGEGNKETLHGGNNGLPSLTPSCPKSTQVMRT